MQLFPTIVLALVCLLSASQWLLPAPDLAVTSELLSLTTGACLALIALSPSLLNQRSRLQIPQQWSWRLFFAAIGVIGLPALLLLVGRQQFSSVMAVATQAGVPCVVAVTFAASDPESDLQQTLIPGLLALTGTLLVLPVGLPMSSQGWSGFVLYLAAACMGGVCAVICHVEMMRFERSAGVAIVLGANAAFLGVITSVWCAVLASQHLLRLPTFSQSLLPTIWTAVSIAGVAALLQLASPMAAAARLIFIPLLATIEAYVLLRPTLSFRTLSGALLMLVGGIACVQAGNEQRSSAKMSLR